MSAPKKPGPSKRPGYRNPPKVAAAVSISVTEANALAALVLGCAIVGRRVPDREIKTVAGIVARAKKSIARARKQRANFDDAMERERGQ